MCLFYLYANAKIEIHICSNKHETGLVTGFNDLSLKFPLILTILIFMCSLNIMVS